MPIQSTGPSDLPLNPGMIPGGLAPIKQPTDDATISDVANPADPSAISDPATMDPKVSANIIWKFMEFEMKAMATMQDDIFGPIDPTTGQRAGGLMGQLNDQNAQLQAINNYLTEATEAQQKDNDNQTISPDLVNYLAQQAGGTDPKTGKPANPLGLSKDSNGHWENSYIHWTDGHYEVKDKKQWQTITTQLNGDSNTMRNDSQVTTIQINAKLTQFQNIQQSMQQAIQGIAGALNQMIQGAAR